MEKWSVTWSMKDESSWEHQLTESHHQEWTNKWFLSWSMKDDSSEELHLFDSHL